MSIQPEVLRNILSSNPFGAVISTLLFMNDGELTQIAEAFESILGRAFRRMLQNESLRREYLNFEGQIFPQPYFMETGPLPEYLNELLKLLRTVDFPSEHPELTSVPIQVRVIENPRCAFCGVLPWGTLLIGKALIRELTHAELVAVLLHEIEHFETFDHTLLLAYLPILLKVIGEEQAPGITRIINVLKEFASHRSVTLERTADNGAVIGLLEFGFPAGNLSGALRSTVRAMKDCDMTLIEAMVESGILPKGTSPTEESALFPSHPDLETRVMLAESLETAIINRDV
jgi:hypothetical protein